MSTFLTGLLGGLLAVALLMGGGFALLLFGLTRLEAPEYGGGSSWGTVNDRSSLPSVVTELVRAKSERSEESNPGVRGLHLVRPGGRRR